MDSSVDLSKYGSIWRDDELDAIVADYFAMLADELSGVAYVKSRHSSALMKLTGRSHRSVEFKHQNISAVLEELGLPWIKGYRPKRNYQSAIIDAVDRFLFRHASAVESISVPKITPEPRIEIFVDSPHPSSESSQLNPRVQRLVRKFDPVDRDYRNRKLGKAGEAFVLECERLRLANVHRSDLAERVRWTANEDGDGAGYDILSFNPTGQELLIEVKTTNGPARTPFFLTRNEFALAHERPEDWRIYRVHLFQESPRIFTLSPPLETSLILTPEAWKASF